MSDALFDAPMLRTERLVNGCRKPRFRCRSDCWLLKLLRKVDSGPNMELEVGQFLARAEPPAKVPRPVGRLELSSESGMRTLAVLIVLHLVTIFQAALISCRPHDGHSFAGSSGSF